MKKLAYALVVLAILGLIGWVTGLRIGFRVYDYRQEILNNLDSVLSKAVTNGNHTYIPLNLWPTSANNHVDVILAIVGAFEKAHPELKVVSWRIEQRPPSYSTIHRIFGIWIDHEPKTR